MKINTVAIQGFGRLRDLSIEFGDGLTVLLGKNEAGKSTITAALRAGLYGLDPSGQGRSKKLEWTRWKPWTGNAYGIVVTYTLSTGESYRVSRDLTTHRNPAQVYRIGGGDVTDQFRVHSRVMPAFFHLGLTEEAFLATACLSEGTSAAVSGAQSGPSRPDEIHDALQRLADSSGNTTAEQARGLLQKALEELGTERAATKPLRKGQDRLESLLARQESTRHDFDTLANIEQQVMTTTMALDKARQEEREIQQEWLLGRITKLRDSRSRLARINNEISTLATTIESSLGYKSFPVEVEGELLQAVGELTQAEKALLERKEMWEKDSSRLEAVRKRCRDISAERSAMGPLPTPADRCAERKRLLQSELNDVVATTSSLPPLPDARRPETLLSEIGATGLGTVPREFFPELPALISQATSRGYLPSLRTGALLGSLGIVALILSPVTSRSFLILPGLLLLAVGIMLSGLGLIQFAPASAARKKIAGMCQGMDVLPLSLEQLAGRIPDVLKLYEALDETRLVLGRQTQQNTEILERLALITGRCEQLALESGVSTGTANHGTTAAPPVRAVDWETPTGMIRRANAALEAVETLLDQHAALSHLEVEEKQLRETEAALTTQHQQFLASDATTRTLRTGVLARIRRTGITVDGDDQAAVVRAVGELTVAAAKKRELENALATRAALETSAAELGSMESLSSEIAALIDSGLSHKLIAQADKLPEIDRTSMELETLRRRGESAMETVRQLEAARQTLQADAQGLRTRLPGRNQLEEEIVEAQEQVAQMERRKAALELADEVLGLVTRRVHREIAPHLSVFLGERLSLLTEGRYSECTVDERTFEVSVRPPESLAFTTVDKLSHGTRDQIGLLLRMALADVFSAETLPLLLDEPLISADPERRARMAEFLRQASLQRQVVITTTDPAVARLLADASPSGKVIELPAALAREVHGVPDSMLASDPLGADPLANSTGHRTGTDTVATTSGRRDHSLGMEPAAQPMVVADIIEEVSRTHPVRRRR